MNLKIFILILTLLNFLNAQEQNIKDINTTEQKDINITKQKDMAFINIISNVKDTTIYLNGNFIGKTPIKQYPVVPYKDIKLMAKIDKNYYEKDLFGTIRVRKHTMPTYNLKFKKAKTKLFLIGEDGDLYINDKFIKKLNGTNRIIKVNAGKNVKIKILNKKNDYFKTSEDLIANIITDIPYKIKTINKGIKLFTTSIDNVMWEDTKEAATKAINWKQANKYCNKLELGEKTDWYMPTIDQLTDLYEDRDKIYNGFGGEFYWSASTFSDKKHIWAYAYVKDFNEGETKKSVKEFERARIRCVRDIYTQEDMEKEEE